METPNKNHVRESESTYKIKVRISIRIKSENQNQKSVGESESSQRIEIWTELRTKTSALLSHRSVGPCAQRRVALMSQAIELELARGTFS